jgi:hypothetical protein
VQVHGLAASTADAAGESTLTSVLLLAAGAAFALVASYVIQAVVVPQVQADIRRRERWENDLNELWSLKNEQLVRAVRRYGSAARVVRGVAELRDEPETDPVLFDEQQRMLERARRDARHAVEEHVDRASVMLSRVRRLGSKAPLWHLLERKFVLYDVQLFSSLLTAAGETGKPVDDEAIEAAESKQEDARKALVNLLEPIVASMRPPGEGRLRRMTRAARARLRPTRRES